MLAGAVLAAAPGNHANVNAKTSTPDNTSNHQMVLIEKDPQLLGGGPGPVLDGQTKP